MGFVVLIGHGQRSLPIMRGAHWGIDKYRLFSYLSGFAENWLEGVYMCQVTPVKSFLYQTTQSKVKPKIQVLRICLSLNEAR